MAIVDNLIQRILLEGDKVITASLTQMGAAGEKAFAGIAAAAVATNAALRSIDMSRVGAAVQTFGRTAVTVFQRGAEAVSNFGTNITALARRMLVWNAASGVVVGGLIAIIKGAADAADQILETADALSLTAQRYQELSSGAVEAGIGTQKLERGLQFLTRTIEGSQRETRQFRNNFEDLSINFRRTTSDIYRNFQRVTEGVQGFQTTTEEAARDTALSDAWRQNQRQIEDLNRTVVRSEDAFRRYNIAIERTADGGIDLNRTLDNIAERIRELGPTFDRASLAQQLFGSRNQKFVNLLSEGSEGLRKMQARARQLGHTVDELTLKIGSRLSDAFERLNFTIRQNSIRILSPLFAPFTDLVDALSLAIANNAAKFQGWVTLIADKVQPVIEDLILLLEGKRKVFNCNGYLTRGTRSLNSARRLVKRLHS